MEDGANFFRLMLEARIRFRQYPLARLAAQIGPYARVLFLQSGGARQRNENGRSLAPTLEER